VRRADIHQHFWPEALLSSLARRTALPRLRDGWLELPGEPRSGWSRFPRPRGCSTTSTRGVLGGLAPLHAERLAARGGPSVAVHDPLTFLDSSSYGPRAVDAMLRVVGVDRLLYGSDRPVVTPHSLAPLGAAAEHAIAVANHERVA